MKTLRLLFALQWQSVLHVLVVLLVVVALLGFRLDSLTPGLSANELILARSASSVDAIIDNPINLPLKLPILGLHALDQVSILTLRLVGAIFGLLTILLFYYVIRQMATRRVALLTSFLFIVSSWFLQTARVAQPLILLTFGMMVLFALGYYISARQHSRLALVIALLSVGTLLYIPGMVWFLVLLAIWQFKTLRHFMKQQPTWLKIVGGIMLLLWLAPLVYALSQEPRLLRPALALPMVVDPLQWLKTLLLIPVFLVARGPLDPTFNLGRLPLLDVFTVVLIILGAYVYYLRLKLEGTRWLLLMTMVATALITFNGVTFLPLLLPIIYIVAQAGVALLLQQWFTVFPRNPIARGTGVLVITIALMMTSFYHISRYFIAWEGNPATRTVFVHELPPKTNL